MRTTGAAAAPTAAGCGLLPAITLLLLPPLSPLLLLPLGSRGEGSCLAPHRHLACQSQGGVESGARDAAPTGAVRAAGPRVPPPRARLGPAGGRRRVHLPTGPPSSLGGGVPRD